ncbi:MAG: type II toxin-antitoxin system VapC family toxin [Bryobacteraceae bacterium]
MSSARPAPLLLDTHYWIWLQLGAREEFGGSMLKAIEKAATGGNLLLSVISVWELGMLEANGRLRLQAPCEEWVQEALATPGLTLVPLTPEIALASSRLPQPFHGDAADRIIVATARSMRARIVTRDSKILEYGRQRHVAVL